jgi:hypothetical protein
MTLRPPGEAGMLPTAHQQIDPLAGHPEGWR